MVIPAPGALDEVGQRGGDVAYVAGVLGIWGAAPPTEAVTWSCDQDGCFVRSRHEHERSVDGRLIELRRINADFERRHPSLRGI